MEDRVSEFREYLLVEKQFTEKRADSVCELFVRINNFLLTKDKGKHDIFEIDSVKVYNDICNKWLSGKFVSMTLKSDAVDFMKYRKLYADYISSSFAKGVTLKDIASEITEITTAVIEEPKGEVLTDNTVKDEIEISEEKVDEIEEAKEVHSFEETIFNICKEVVSLISNDDYKKVSAREKVEGTAYFDIENECCCIVSDNTIDDKNFDSYSIINDKAFLHDEKYLSDFSNDISTYRVLFKLGGTAIKERIIEKTIKDSLVDYKIGDAYCLLPDLLDDFNKEIKSQINYNGKRIFTIPKSVALLFSFLKKKKLVSKEEYYVVDYDGNETSVTNLLTREDEETGKPKIIRKGLRKISSGHITYKTLADKYLSNYCTKYKLNLTDTQKENIVYSKSILHLFNDKKPIVFYSGDAFFEIKHDPIIVQQLRGEFVADLNELKSELNINKNLFVINSMFSEYYSSADLFDGCAEIHNRIKNREYLWEEYLPKLSLEVIDDGRFNVIELIPENEYRDVLKVLDEEEIIPVDGTITLGSGKEQYRLPLNREVIGSINSQKEACLKHSSFPLHENVQVKMEIRYRYGDEDSYKLIFYPLEADAPFEKIENIWEDPEYIESIATPKIEQVSQEMNNDEINKIIQGLWDANDRLLRITKGQRCPRDIRINPNTNIKESQIFFLLNVLHTPRRKFFSTYMCMNNEYVRRTIKDIFDNGLLEKMYQIITPISNWKNLFEDEEYKVVKANVERLLIDMGAIYALKVRDEQGSKLVENIVNYFIENNKLWQLVPLSRCIKNDRFGIFNKITDRIMDKVSNKGIDLTDLRTISSNCWQSKEWIENFYYAKNGQEATYYVIDRAINFILDFNVDDIRNKQGYNPRAIRDVLELLLCFTRADDLVYEDTGKVYFDPNSEKIKHLIEKIKLIDYYMDEFSYNLGKDFVSRLNANIDKKDLYRVNEISYMLIQTLSGKESIELIGFNED